MNKKAYFIFILVALFTGVFIFSCVKKIGKLPVVVPAPPPPGLCDSATYTFKIKAIIDAKCAIPSCHPSGVVGRPPLSNYGEVSAKAARIQVRALDQETMPQIGSPQLTAHEKDLIKCWLDKSTPQ